MAPESSRAEESNGVHCGSHTIRMPCRICLRVGTPLHPGEGPVALPCSYLEGKQSELKASLVFSQRMREAVKYPLWEGGNQCQRYRPLGRVGKGTGNDSDVSLF